MQTLLTKRAQLAIWVIVGVIFAGSILLLFLLPKSTPINPPGDTNPLDVNAFVRNCIENRIKDGQKDLFAKGGFFSPKNYCSDCSIEPVEYICENNLFIGRCIPLHENLTHDLEGEIKKYVEDNVPECFRELENETLSRKGTIEFNSPEVVEVILDANVIKVTVNRDISITKNDKTSTYESFNTEINSPLYNLAVLAFVIAIEANSCVFDAAPYLESYPMYSFETKKVGTSRVFLFKDNPSGLVFTTAMKNCPL